jgi:hypothetical protein
MMDAASELHDAFRDAWLLEYTPYRMRTALGRWDAEYLYWLRLQNRFRHSTAGLKEGDNLPSLESIIGAAYPIVDKRP